MRLNTERQNKLEPIRMQIAINEIQILGLTILNCTDKMIEFEYKGQRTSLIQDGQLERLLKTVEG